MKFSIDVIGLDRDLKVIKLWSRLVPFRVTSVSLKLRSVIELPPGRIDECQVSVGDQLRIADAAKCLFIPAGGFLSSSCNQLRHMYPPHPPLVRR